MGVNGLLQPGILTCTCVFTGHITLLSWCGEWQWSVEAPPCETPWGWSRTSGRGGGGKGGSSFLPVFSCVCLRGWEREREWTKTLLPTPVAAEWRRGAGAEASTSSSRVSCAELSMDPARSIQHEISSLKGTPWLFFFFFFKILHVSSAWYAFRTALFSHNSSLVRTSS